MAQYVLFLSDIFLSLEYTSMHQVPTFVYHVIILHFGYLFSTYAQKHRCVCILFFVLQYVVSQLRSFATAAMFQTLYW